MRTYPRNSPQAAARIVALVLLADGHVCSSEERALEAHDAAGLLRLSRGEFAAVMQGLCEDLEVANLPFAPGVGQIDTAALATLLAEIDAPALRRTIVELSMTAAVADGHLADGEIALLARIAQAWSITAPVRDGTRRAPHAAARRAA